VEKLPDWSRKYSNNYEKVLFHKKERHGNKRRKTVNPDLRLLRLLRDEDVC
jgi:hypothetical protein